jgi:8-oxo-dGTP diphosphatase
MSCKDVTLPPPPPFTKTVVVGAACIFDADGRVLLAEHVKDDPYKGLWEFPGGKLEAGETADVALVRELKEELGITVCRACLFPITFASYVYAEISMHAVIMLFGIRQWECGEGGAPQSHDGQRLRWVHPRDLKASDLLPGNVAFPAAIQSL